MTTSLKYTLNQVRVPKAALRGPAKQEPGPAIQTQQLTAQRHTRDAFDQVVLEPEQVGELHEDLLAVVEVIIGAWWYRVGRITGANQAAIAERSV
jgi:hypothetical protein